MNKPKQQCGRCRSGTIPVTLSDGQRIGWYCGDCHALTTTHGKLEIIQE